MKQKDKLLYIEDNDNESNLKDLLLKRNGEFVKTKFFPSPVNGSLRTIVVTCMDSRIQVSDIFNANAGELIVLRNAGNKFTDDILRSLLIGVLELHAKYIIILGHTSCGMAWKDNKEVVHHIMEELSPGLKQELEKKDGEKHDILHFFGCFDHGEWIQNAKQQQKEMLEYLKDKLKPNLMPKVIPALYDLQTGKVSFL